MRSAATTSIVLVALCLGLARAEEDGEPDGDTNSDAKVFELNEQNFEHLTQAATGATTGDWLVKFCKSSVSRCSRVESTWSKLSAQLAASRDAKGMVRVNVASVDTTDSGWLTKRFGITSVPVVLLFKGGVMYSFHGGGFSVDRLMQFAERDYVHSSRMLVPPEPHVATPHDQTFLPTRTS